MSPPPLIEICVTSLSSALTAQNCGADRVELCQNLEVGGTTPSVGLITKVKQILDIPVHVLVRPRAGDFVYDEDEVGVMVEDVRACRGVGVDGVVVGCLTRWGKVDVEGMRRLVEAAGPMGVTFHRAFDDVVDPVRALEDVVRVGCERVLTSGGEGTAVEGVQLIKRLCEVAEGRVVVMPGAGVSGENLPLLMEVTGAREFHASAKGVVDENREGRRASRFDVVQWRTDGESVRALVRAARGESGTRAGSGS